MSGVRPMIPLAEAAQKLKRGWRSTWEMVLRGELPAERRNGRWWLDSRVVDAIVQQENAGSGPTSAD